MPSELAPDDRIGMLDTTRGIAVLGILMMNITGFGLPNSYDDPTVWGGDAPVDIATWRVMSLLFEGTMRGLFTLLFGASALLFLQRHDARSSDMRPADLYFRRTLWLIAFGLINGYVLLWSGDVLFYYGIAGLALFVFRNLSPRKLLACAAVLMALQTSVSVIEWHDYRETHLQAQAASTRQYAGHELSVDEIDAIDAFSNHEQAWRPSRADLENMVANIRESYIGAFSVLSKQTWFMETQFFFRHGIIECLGMMLLGMALLKFDVLTGAASTRTYVTMIVVGYVIGLTVNTLEIRAIERAGFSPESLIRTFMTYDLGRIPMTLGHLGVIGLLCRTPRLSGISRLFGATGQMSLTNYLSQSVLCLFIFTGAGLALYGQFSRHELYYIVAAIWILQLAWSPVWLRYFCYGPAEWVWRSLTYGRRQPLRRSAPRAPVIST
ncbi:MAG: DUF418 domain-containing protein [Steroidobacter sp.]